MMLRLASVLDPNQLDTVRRLLADAKFIDGKISAGQAAQRVKRNVELDARDQSTELLNNLVMNALVRHPDYRAGALPLRVASPYYARYTPGMAYGTHLDDPIMGADGVLYRSDIAITLFLNEPDQYDGGELVISTAFGENAVKLPAGDAILYPASSRHRVNPVSRGERLVAVTWVQSLVREPARRELLYELNRAREKMLQHSPEAEETAQVNTAYLNLIRMWGDI